MEEENLEFEIVSRDEIIVAVSDKTVAVSTVLYQHRVERLDSWNRPGTPLSPPTSTLTGSPMVRFKNFDLRYTSLSIEEL